MPLIDDDEFLKMCEELDRLKENEKDLQKGYIDLKLENNEIKKYKSKRNIIISFLIIITFGLVLYLYKRQVELNTIKEQKNKIEKLLYSVQNKKIKNKVLPVTKLVYSVQIEGFEKYNITEQESLKTKNSNKNPNIYIAGKFHTYQKANEFKDKVKKIGAKDVFVIALYDGKKIPLSKALKLSNN